MVEEKEYKIEEAEENSDNKEFMIDAILHHASWVIAYASERLLSDKELMLEAVKADGQELYYASKELCGAASPSQGHREPDSLRAALSLGGEAPAWECRKKELEDIKKNGPDPLEITCRNCGSVYKISTGTI